MLLFAAVAPIVDPAPRHSPPYTGPWPAQDTRPGDVCNHGARIVNAAVPDYPDVARDLGLGHVVAVVEVLVGDNGLVKAMRIYKSAGNAEIDHAAMRVAYTSTYQAARKKCRAILGTYLFRVDFNPGA